MPFTLAHGAAALPFRWSWVVPSALVVGTFAPDFEYFLWMAPRSGFGHSLLGVFALTLPLGLAVLWVFHAWVKWPAVGLMPEGLQRRLRVHPGPFRWLGAGRIWAVLSSMMLGIATHVVWDWFTHRGSWLYRRWALLRGELRLPGLGWVADYKLLQHGSTVVGLAVLGVWFVLWYRKAGVGSRLPVISFVRRCVVLSLVIGFAGIGAAIRVIAFGGGSLEGVFGQAVCAFVALAWSGMVVYGAFETWRFGVRTGKAVSVWE